MEKEKTAKKFEISFFGHVNIRSNHRNTIEITKESSLTPSGDCIVGVGATASCNDLPQGLKERLRDSSTRVTIVICVQGHKFIVNGAGHPNLSLTHDTDIVIRKSDFTCPRTMAVRCDKAADVIPREMVMLLRDSHAQGTFTVMAD